MADQTQQSPSSYSVADIVSAMDQCDLSDEDTLALTQALGLDPSEVMAAMMRMGAGGNGGDDSAT